LEELRDPKFEKFGDLEAYGSEETSVLTCARLKIEFKVSGKSESIEDPVVHFQDFTKRIFPIPFFLFLFCCVAYVKPWAMTKLVFNSDVLEYLCSDVHLAEMNFKGQRITV